MTLPVAFVIPVLLISPSGFSLLPLFALSLPTSRKAIEEMKLDDSLLQQHLGHPLFGLLTATADEMALSCYVVGGYVRDIFLQRPSRDIDVVTVGSGIGLAKAFAAKLGRQAHLAVFRNFGTAQVKYKGHEIEFVANRSSKTVPLPMTRTGATLPSTLWRYALIGSASAS